MRDQTPGIRFIRRMRENAALNAAFAALDTDDEYTRAFHVAEQADRQLHELAPVPDYDRAVADIIDRGEMPTDFRAWLHQHNNATAVHQAETTALTNLRNQAAGRCWAIFTAYTPQLLTNLHRQLAELIDRSRQPATVLAGLDDAEAVLRAGGEAARAFGELDEHWKTYTEIRSAQNRIMREFVDEVLLSNCRTDHCPDPAADDTHFANLDQVFPQWRRRSGDTQSMEVTASGIPLVRPVTAPWPERGPMQLSWFINHDAQFWVPTPDQLRALHTQRRTRPEPNVSKRTRPGPEERHRLRHQNPGISILA